MKRFLPFAILFFVIISVSTAQGQEKEKEKSIQIRWYGQSFFQVTTVDGTKIVFDPHAMTEYGRQLLKGDLVLISHLHDDHSQFEILENADELKKLEKERVFFGVNLKSKGKEWNKINGKYKNITFRNIPCYHDNEEGMKRGKNSIFIVETDGLKIAHLGDLGHLLEEETLKEIGEVDILMIPIGGIYTINGGNAREVIKAIKPRLYILPMHYGTKVFDGLQEPTEFLEGQKNVRRIESNLLTVPVNLKQDVPSIVLMGFSPVEGK